MNIYSIYKVTNITNGKCYIGFDSNWPNRKKIHKSSYNKKNYKFYYAVRKYGWENFVWEVIYQSKEKEHTLKVIENHFIELYDTFKNGYNSTLGGEGVLGLNIKPNLGKKFSNEWKNNISLSKKGKKIKPCSPDHRKKLSTAKKGKKIKKQSIEHKNNISFALKGKKLNKIICRISDRKEFSASHWQQYIDRLECY